MENQYSDFYIQLAAHILLEVYQETGNAIVGVYNVPVSLCVVEHIITNFICICTKFLLLMYGFVFIVVFSFLFTVIHKVVSTCYNFCHILYVYQLSQPWLLQATFYCESDHNISLYYNLIVLGSHDLSVR